MTIEEAIENRERCLRYLEGCAVGTDKEGVEAVRLSLAALREKAEREDPKPLTLDELRGMDGEPVWIVEGPDWGHWELSADAEDYLEGRDADFYGAVHKLGWLAYRHKPKEAKR